MCRRKCTSWEGQKAGAKGDGSECALWEPELETSLISNLHWRVSCPFPEGKRSPRLTKHQEPFAEQCQASDDAALVSPSSRQQEGRKPACNKGTLGTPGTSKHV